MNPIRKQGGAGCPRHAGSTLIPPVLRLLASVLCLLLVSARAQTPPAEEKKPASLRFLFLDESTGAYSLKNGADFKRLSAAPYTISPPYTPPDLKRLDIYKVSSTLDPKTGLPVQVLITSFTPPSGTKSALVIVTPRPAAPGSNIPPPYDVEFIDNDASSFPGGSIRLLNRGKATMAARLAGEQITAEPGTSKIISPVADQRGRLRILIAVQGPDQWRMIDDNVAIVKPDTRVTGVLVYSPSGMKFRLGPYILAERGDSPPSHAWLTYTDTP